MDIFQLFGGNVSLDELTDEQKNIIIGEIINGR